MWRYVLSARVHRICSPHNQQRVHAWIVYDLLKTGLDTCKPIVIPKRDRTAKLPLVTAPMEIVSPSADTEIVTDPHRTERIRFFSATTARIETP